MQQRVHVSMLLFQLHRVMMQIVQLPMYITYKLVLVIMHQLQAQVLVMMAIA
jgi:hypothetical protein